MTDSKLSHLSKKAQEDYKLILAAQEGDEDAYARLLARYNDAVYYMLLKNVRNKADAEDLTLEAFTKAFNSLDTYETKYAFSTWLFKIAKNNCVDFLRKKNGVTISIEEGKEKDTQKEPVIIKCSNSNPEQGLIERQRAVMVHNIVGQLKPQYKEMVELRYFREFTYEEIAATLDIPIGTVKVQLHRAKKRLFTIFEKNDITQRHDY